MKPNLFCYFLVFIFFGNLTQAQDFKLSEYASISVLTCEPGTDLYASFGHSAIRVQDPMMQLDIIYNYGIFDFYAPNFYTNFIKGNLTYTLGRQYFSDFLFEYEMENRGVKEQVLRLDKTNRDRLFNFLEKNYRPENRDYSYDFFYNNCATKIRDLLEDKELISGVQINQRVNEHKTFRDLLAENLAENSWALFGINLALGSKVDKIVTPREYQFLPNYLSESLKTMTIYGEDLEENDRMSYESKPTKKVQEKLYNTPAFLSFLVLILSLIIGTVAYFTGVKLWGFDLLLFGLSALGSLLLLFLWFLTNHHPTVNNFNLLWVSPWAFLMIWIKIKTRLRKATKAESYIALIFVLSLSATPFVHWIGIQKFDPLFFPIIGALWMRSVPLAFQLNPSK
jgi:hypothetical protein